MIRENWRIVLLVVLVVASSAALFGPLGSGSAADGGDANATSPTNLQYGLELSGGTRIRAPLAGLHATPDIGDADPNQLQRDLAAELNVSLADVAVLNPTQELPNGAVEVRTGNVTRAEFAAALRANDIDVSENQVDLGVTERTRDQTVRVLNSKINEGGLTGGSVTTTQTENGTYVVVEVPNANRSEVIGLIGTPGRVQVVALSPAENGTGFERQPLLDQSDLTVSGVVTRQTPGGGRATPSASPSRTTTRHSGSRTRCARRGSPASRTPTASATATTNSARGRRTTRSTACSPFATARRCTPRRWATSRPSSTTATSSPTPPSPSARRTSPPRASWSWTSGPARSRRR
ncbi:hypothetical protein [Halosegnis marinus]|uniref:hypothetical protein n=1 Tax=Halosegnis marinus TaxID=3034023 RepID=UPI003610C720